MEPPYPCLAAPQREPMKGAPVFKSCLETLNQAGKTPTPPRPLGRHGVTRRVDELLKYAESELKGLPKAGYNETRLTVWREVLQSFAEHMPQSQMLLSRVQSEYDEACSALQREIKTAEHEVDKAYKAQERAAAAAVAAKKEAQDQVRKVIQNYEDALEAQRKRQAENSVSMLNAELVLGSLQALAVPQRLDCIQRAVTAQPEAVQRGLLSTFLLRRPAAERANILALALQPGLQKAKRARRAGSSMRGLELENLSAVGNEDEAEDAGMDLNGEAAEAQALLEALPERIRSRLCNLAYRSLSSEGRKIALAELLAAPRE